MLRLTLLRHPHCSFATNEQVMRVDHDPDITPTGRRQLDHFKETLRVGHRRQWDTVISSNLRRALHPAREIAEALDVGHASYNWLNEIAWDPNWDGKPYDEINPKFERWLQTDSHYDYLNGPGGNTEHLAAHRTRVQWGLDAYLDSLGCPTDFCGDLRYENVLIVAHHFTISNIIAHLLGHKGYHHPYKLGFLKSVDMVLPNIGQWRMEIG